MRYAPDHRVEVNPSRETRRQYRRPHRKRRKQDGIKIDDNDIIIVAQKIISKAEGSVLRLNDVVPSPMAQQVALASGKDPRHVEAILRESASIVRMVGAHLIVETRHGFVCANAGVDRSNVEDQDSVVLLPKDPDQSARISGRESDTRRAPLWLLLCLTLLGGRGVSGRSMLRSG